MKRVVFSILFLILAFFVLIPQKPVNAQSCTTPGAPCGECVVKRCPDGSQCATSHTYCVWHASGNTCGDCSTAEIDNCATQCPSSPPSTGGNGSGCKDGDHCCVDYGEDGHVDGPCSGITNESKCWTHAGSGCAWLNGSCGCNSTPPAGGGKIEGDCHNFTNNGTADVQVSVAQCGKEYWPDQTKSQCQQDANKGVGCQSSTITLKPKESHSLSGPVSCGIWQIDAAGAGWTCADTGCNWNDSTCSAAPSLTIQGKLYCQDGTGTSFPITNATVPVFMAGSNKTVTATTGADGSYSVSAQTTDGAFAVRKPTLPSTGKLSNNQPYTTLLGPSPVNCNNATLTTCTLSDTTGSLCTGNSYEHCSLTQGSHGNFDFKYTNCTPQVYACSGILPTTSDFSRGSTYTFSCQGSGNAAKTANFRVVSRTGTSESTLASSASAISLDSTLKASWQYTIPQSAAAGNYAVQCQICDATNHCTSWGKAN